LDESEHVPGHLAKVLISDGFGKGNIVGEPIGGESISDTKGAWNVTFVAAVMFSGRTDIPAVKAVGCQVVARLRHWLVVIWTTMRVPGGATGLLLK
jgi:hypothetical protein